MKKFIKLIKEFVYKNIGSNEYGIYNEENIVTEVLCPLVDEIIEDIDCIENRDIIDGCFKMSCLPKKYKSGRENFKEICKQCKWHCY